MSHYPQVSPSWDQRYQDNDIPWHHSSANAEFLRLMETYVPAHAPVLDVGCGLGVETLALANLGFQMTGIDISTTAITKAKQLAKAAGKTINYLALDIVDDHQQIGQFPGICDVACLHTFTTPKGRKALTEIICEHLSPQGIWINLSCAKPVIYNVSDQNSVKAPPGLSLTELAEACEDKFILLEGKLVDFPVTRLPAEPVDFPAWASVWQKL